MPDPATAPSADEHLAREYLYLTGVWDDFDRRALTIKGWSAAGAGAGLLALGSGKELGPLALAIIVLLCSFWVLEAHWKRFQHSNFERIAALEGHFASRVAIPGAFQCHANSRKVLDHWGWRRLLHEMRQPIVFIPYLPLLIALGLVGLWPPAGAPASARTQIVCDNIVSVANRR